MNKKLKGEGVRLTSETQEAQLTITTIALAGFVSIGLSTKGCRDKRTFSVEGSAGDLAVETIGLPRGLGGGSPSY